MQLMHFKRNDELQKRLITGSSNEEGQYVLLSEHKERSGKKGISLMVFMAGISRKLLKPC